jgi:hypothetical protein
VLRIIFRLEREEIIGDWRNLNNEELNKLYSSPSTRIIRMMKSRRMRCAGHVGRMRYKFIVYRILVGKTEGKGPLGRPRRRWVYLRDIGFGVIYLGQDRDQGGLL